MIPTNFLIPTNNFLATELKRGKLNKSAESG